MDGTALIERSFSRLDRRIPEQDIQALVLIVTDNGPLARSLEMVCDFLGLAVEILTSDQSVGRRLESPRPMAIITEADGHGQDGFHVMKEVARHDRDLPILFVTGADPILMGAAEAVCEVNGLTSVTMTPQTPPVGELVDFLFRAGRRFGWGRMIPT
jgi:CheY-like chemotaxis protein